MSRALALAFAIVFLATAAACGGDGGDPDRVLQLSGRSSVLQLNDGAFTEEELRSLTRDSIVAADENFEFICAALDGLTDDQAVEVQLIVQYSGFPPVGEDLVLDDEIRATQILREECEAAY